MLVDFERAWLELKAEIVSKNSHGQRDLLSRMAQIEVASRVPEGERDFDGSTIPYHRRQPATERPREVARHG